MDIEFNQGFIDYQYVKTLESHEDPFGKGWPRTFLLRCILYGFSSGASVMMAQSFSSLNAPLMVLFNKTSTDMFGLHDGGALLLSGATWIAMSGMVFSIAALIPLMDYFGRKFICVYIKFLFTSVGVALMIAAWALQNALFYLFGLTFVVVSAAILGLADPIFISEIAPKEHKGFFTASVLSFAGVFAGFCLILAREDIWGTPENWGRIAVLAEFLNIFVLMAGLFLPDSPGKCKESTISVFYAQHFRKFAGIFKAGNGTRKKIFLLMAMQIFLLANVNTIEISFPIPVYRDEGMVVNEVLAMILLNFIITIPISWFGPLAVDRLGKKRIVMMLLGFLICKTTLHFINGQLQFWGLSYLNAFLQRVIEGSGLPAITFVLATDILPPNFVVTAGQLAMMSSCSLLGLLASISPFTFGHFLPEYLICITLFSTGMAVLVLWLWRRVENEEEQPADQEPLLRKGSPPPEYSALT
ncbi:unnamed protein product, partial [Mesorhabditis spiculigera]